MKLPLDEANEACKHVLAALLSRMGIIAARR